MDALKNVEFWIALALLILLLAAAYLIKYLLIRHVCRRCIRKAKTESSKVTKKTTDGKPAEVKMITKRNKD